MNKAWGASPMPAVTVPDAIGRGIASAVRKRLEQRGWTRYALLDRGSYEHVDHVDEPELLDALVTLATGVTGRELAVEAVRALCLRPGDYLLVRHDRVHEGRPVELVLDLSDTRVPGAAVHYRHRGQVFYEAPSAASTLAIVERGPTVMCNHTYVSRRLIGAEVVRLVVLLRDASGR